ncbi:MAG: alpha/beta hydrolase [Pseudomonadota bacterium]
MADPAERHAPLGRAADASRQLEQAVRFICRHHGVAQLSLVAHSWGTIVAGDLAGRCPELIDRLVLFGPIAQRPRQAEPTRLPGWRLISLKDQWEPLRRRVPRRRAGGAEPATLRRLGASAISTAIRRVAPARGRR